MTQANLKIDTKNQLDLLRQYNGQSYWSVNSGILLRDRLQNDLLILSEYEQINLTLFPLSEIIRKPMVF